jgi:glycerophosphoryl diester phosphodiesterase
MKNTLRSVAALFSAFVALSVQAHLTFAHETKKIEVQGHRGCRALRPENTLPAFEHAVRLGVDVLEMDIAVTKDNQLVISHDPYITPERCLDGDGKVLTDKVAIHSLLLSEVQKYDCGSIKNPKFPDQVLVPHTPMPTLDEMFNRVSSLDSPNSKKVRFNIETKIFVEHPELTPSAVEFADLLVKNIDSHKMLSRSIIQSFDYRTLVAAKKINPFVKTAMLSTGGFYPYVTIAKKYGFTYISSEHIWLNEEAVKELHANHIEVIPWTVNDPAGWDRLIKMGVDGIISDNPEALIKYLKEKGLR